MCYELRVSSERRKSRRRRSCGDEACWDRLGHGLEKAMTSFGSTDVCCIQHANAGGISRIAQHSVMDELSTLLQGCLQVWFLYMSRQRENIGGKGQARACDQRKRKSLIVKVVAGPRGSLPQSNHHPRPPLRPLPLTHVRLQSDVAQISESDLASA
jgi:hypothetical protein